MVNANYNVPGNFKPSSHVNNEIKSHSSVLYNERLHVLLYILETESIDIHSNPKFKDIVKVKSTLFQIWKNLRTLLFNDPSCRIHLGIETNTKGLYTPDVGFKEVDNLLSYLRNNTQFITIDNLLKIVDELDQIEIILRNVLQYYKYFMRFEKPQKPDIDIASERYKQMMDERTFNELKEVMGKNAKFDINDFNKPLDESYFEDFEDD